MFRRGKAAKLSAHFEKWNPVTGGSGRQPAKLPAFNENDTSPPCQMHLLPV
jgi:hypothetical protein